MIKHSHPSLNMKTLKKEIEILAQLSHPNIVNLIEFHESIDYVKKNGQTYKVVSIVMELVPNGELFEYVADSGRFSEKVARSYFKILIESKKSFEKTLHVSTRILPRTRYHPQRLEA